MGWIQKKQTSHTSQAFGTNCTNQATIECHSNTTRKYPFAHLGTHNEALPFIPPDLISRKSQPGRLAIKGQTANEPSRKDWWIVIDNIVYDCTDFILEHPGGEQVIMSFIGEDCTWQFRRFHSQRIVEEDARPLRIGRTEGVRNRFKEPKRFSGLSGLGTGDEW